MNHSIPDFSSLQTLKADRVWPMFCLVLLIHIGLFFLFLPKMMHSPPPAPVRIPVQISQLQPEPEVEPPPIKQTQKKPIESIKPLLTAREDVPVEPEDMLVPLQDEDVEVVEEPEPAPVIEPEPKPIEPKKPEAKKPEPKKPKPKEPKPKPVEKPKPVVEKPKKVVEKPKPVAEPEVAELEPVETEETVEPTDKAVPSSDAKVSSTIASENASENSTTINGTGTDENATGNTNAVGRNEAWSGYGQLLYAMVSKNKYYPQQAIRRNLEGTVMVEVRIENGRMTNINVLGQGSGHTVLDKAARQMLEKAVKALPVQGNLSGKSFSVVVPVNFKLTS